MATQLLRSLLSARAKEVENVSRSRAGWQTNKPPLSGHNLLGMRCDNQYGRTCSNVRGRVSVPPVLAALLVVVTGARVGWRHRIATPVGALAAVTTTWILSGRGNVAGGHLGRHRTAEYRSRL